MPGGARMPYKAKHPCGHPGCPNLTDKGYCKEHQKEYNAEYNNFHRGYKSSERYGSAWRKIRARYVKEHPLCERCLKEGRLVPVQIVHHILPKAEGGSDDFGNLMSLCQGCHNKVHGLRGADR